MTETARKLTKPQAEALRKWVEYGKPAAQKFLGINEGVYDRLWNKGLLGAHGYLARFPNQKGIDALAQYDAAPQPSNTEGRG